jgi:CheY-like chemotaxis protein
VTASAFAHERSAVIEAGCDDFVAKPFRSATVFEKLAEHLGVRFVYSRTPHGSGSRDAETSIVTPARLGALPSPLVAELNKAVVQGDVESALGAVDEVARIDEQLGQELRALVRAYRFDDILDCVTKL